MKQCMIHGEYLDGYVICPHCIEAQEKYRVELAKQTSIPIFQNGTVSGITNNSVLTIGSPILWKPLSVDHHELLLLLETE